MENVEIIRARTKDDAAILIGRLMKSKHSEIILILPKNSMLAADLNSLKILKEEAESVNKNLYIDTESKDIKKFAEKIQLPIYDANCAPAKEKEIKEPKRETRKMLDITPPAFHLAKAERLSVESKPEPELELEPDLEINTDSEPKIDFIPQQETGVSFNEEGENLVGENAIADEIARKNTIVGLGANDNSELEKDLEAFYNEPKNKAEIKQSKIGFKKSFSLKQLIASFIGVGILLLAAAMYLILPKANVKLSLKEVPIKLSIQTAVSKNITAPDLANGILPGQYFLLTKSGSKAIEIIGADDSANLPVKAGGLITVYNAYSAAPQKLIAQTRFETKDGKVFRIQKSITVPGAKMSGSKLIPSSIKTEVVSDAAGKEYLIGPSYFTIPGFKGSPKYAGFYAESAEPMAAVSGGLAPAGQTQAIEITKENLKNELANELKNDTLNAYKNSNFVLIDGASTVKADEVKVDSQIVSMKITWQAVFFNEKDFRSLVNYTAVNKYPVLQNFDFRDTISYPQAFKADFKKGEIFFTFDLNKDNAFVVDLAGLKKNLAGLDENGMRNVIAGKNFVNSASISLWPFWVRQAPNSPDKINITLDNQ
ncbi:hypothetical protein HY838_01660 [Candidatus Azambacteria bacterium]|nr:hypothetical protein [Candidatus Azambacteria bacterium]